MSSGSIGYNEVMCGRFTLRTKGKQLADFFDLPDAPDLQPRFNIAPSQPVLAVRQLPQGRELALLTWGLVPHWSKESKGFINARAETAANRSAFRWPFRHHRCLIAADGFYEWRQERKLKQPYYFVLPHKQPFAFSGLWDHWEGDGEAIKGCTILTTDANEVVRPVHERMPVILEPKDWNVWLDPNQHDPKQVQSLLRPYGGTLTAYPVSTLVNRPHYDGPELIKPLG
jgi:putative SOS response-associated peptidase YedK